MPDHPALPTTDDAILTTRGAARLLGVAVSTAQLWMESGALDSWKTPGGHRRVRLSAVTRLLDEKKAARARRHDGPGAALPRDPEFLAHAQPAYPVDHLEAQRLLSLYRLGLVDTPAEEVFDRVAWLATQVTDAPIALITLLTSTRQWFKARIGVDAGETPREWAFCTHAVLQDETMVVEDARLDARFAANPLVTGEPGIRFYAGVPLRDADGVALGTLCVIDREPRKLRARELRALRELGAIAADELCRRAPR